MLTPTNKVYVDTGKLDSCAYLDELVDLVFGDKDGDG